MHGLVRFDRKGNVSVYQIVSSFATFTSLASRSCHASLEDIILASMSNLAARTTRYVLTLARGLAASHFHI